jgi:hypothetical protein
MALTENQVEALFRFCEKKFVRQYDLQVELVDHLAERIEEEMAADPRLSFDEALQKVYKGFGIFGFAHIVQDRSNMLYKRNNKLWWSQVKAFFVLPRIVLTLSLGLVFYQAAGYISGDLCGIVLYIAWLSGFIFQIVALRRFQKSMTKTLMLTQNLPGATLITPFFIIQDLFYTDTPLSRYPVAFSILMVIGIIYHAAFIFVIKKVSDEARELYPQAFRAAS